MKKAICLIDKYLEETMIAAMMAYFVIASVWQIITRFVIKMPAAWTEETARYTFIWMMFIGASAAVKNSSHIRIDIMENIFKSEKVKAGFQLFGQITLLIFTAISTIVGIAICIKLTKSVQLSPVLEIPFLYIYLSMPVGMGLATIRIIQTFFKNKTNKLEV